MVDETAGDHVDHRRFYEAESSQRAGRELRGQRLEMRAKFIAESDPGLGPLLEIGTGPGLDAAAFGDAGFRVFGIDLATANARRTSLHPLASAVAASATHLPFRSNRAAYVWSVSTLMHLNDDEIVAALREIRRVAMPDARIVLGTWGGSDEVDVSRQHPFGARRFHRRRDSTWVRLLDTHLGSVDGYEMATHESANNWFYQWAFVSPRTSA